MTPDTPDFEVLYRRFVDRKATIGVIGLGYVGLPLARASVAAGFKVIGVDIDPEKIAALKAGRSYIRHLDGGLFKELIAADRFEPTTDFSMLAEAHAILICVPTPLTSTREPDLTYVTNAAQSIVPNLRSGQLVVLESTTYPGTTREVVKPLLEARGAVSGRDFFLGYSPEREDPGSTHFDISKIPKVVGGDGKDALRLACALYDQLAARTVAVSSLEIAEATKLLENIFRAVNIAFINELKIIYSALGIDVWEVIEAAKTKPFGFMPFYPGPGLGGHCVPIDPFYLSWKARKYDLAVPLIDLAGEINTAMPGYVVARVTDVLKSRFHRGLGGCRVLILGVAYKKNLDDIRESPALKLIDLFEERGATVDYYDPHANIIPRTLSYPHLANRQSIAWSPEAIATYDFVVIVTDHDSIDYHALTAHARLVFDTRNACQHRGASGENVFKV
jgi:UDP-N-acetyl-D-glucosamine dehydrogenase